MRIFRIGLGGRERRMFDTHILNFLVLQVCVCDVYDGAPLPLCAVSCLSIGLCCAALQADREAHSLKIITQFLLPTPVCVDHAYIDLRDLCTCRLCWPLHIQSIPKAELNKEADFSTLEALCLRLR